MTVYVGGQIQASAGSWQGSPTSYAFQWQDSTDGAALNADVSGATRSDYIVDVTELGLWLRARVVATNAGGDSDPVYSAWVGPVGEAPVEVAAGSRRKNRRSKGGTRPSGRIRRTVV